MVKNKYILGTAVKITALLNVDTATSAKITIEDSGENLIIDSADMTKDADGKYSYIFQSNSTWTIEGDYVATMEISYGGYTAVVQEKMEFYKWEGASTK